MTIPKDVVRYQSYGIWRSNLPEGASLVTWGQYKSQSAFLKDEMIGEWINTGNTVTTYNQPYGWTVKWLTSIINSV